MAFDADSNAVLAALIDYAKAAGAEASEASIASRESISAEVRMGELEGMEREEGRSVALRAFLGKRQAAASSTDLSATGLKALAERVAAMARAAPEDKYCGLLETKHLARDQHADLDQSDTARPSPQQLLELARICEAASLQIPGVANSGGGGASSEVSRFIYATSTGFEGAETGTSYSLGTQPIAERGDDMERDYEYRTKRFFADLPSPEEIGRMAGERTVRRLGARKLASAKAPVIFENRLAGRIISPVFGAISGSSVARGVSFLKDKLGKRVFAEGFRVHEDPFVKRGLASRAFDGEGGAVKADDADRGRRDHDMAAQFGLGAPAWPRAERACDLRPWRPAGHRHIELIRKAGRATISLRRCATPARASSSPTCSRPPSI